MALPRDREGIFGLTLCLTLAAVLFELAATSSFYLLDILLVLLAALVLLVLLDRSRTGGGAALARGLFGRVRGSAAVLVLLGLYLARDLAGVFYSPAPGYAIDKYKVVVLMLFLSFCMLMSVGSPESLRGILLALGVAAGLTAAFAVVNYLLANPFPIFYTMRLTLRRDYNVFATTLLLGFLCACYLFATAEHSPAYCALFALDAGVTLTVLYLSGSRRVFLMLPPLLLFWLAIWLFRQKSWRGLLLVMGTVLAAGLLFWCGTLVLQTHMRAQYNRFGGYGFGQESSGSTGESTPADRYETATESSMFTKRKIIWGIAWEEYKGFPPAQKLFGAGFAHDIVLYDETESPALEKEYAHLNGEKGLLSAHNFVLADLLNGGLLGAGLGLALLLSLAWACVALALRSFPAAALYGSALAVVAANSLVSNRYGLLYDKFFYIFALLLVLHLGFCRGARKELGEQP